MPPTLKQLEREAREAFEAAANRLNNARPHHVQDRMSRAARNVLQDVGLRNKPALEEAADAMNVAKEKLEEVARSVKNYVSDPETERQAKKIAQRVANEAASFVAECDKLIKSIDFSAIKKDIAKAFTSAWEGLKQAANDFVSWCKSIDIFPKVTVPTPEQRSARSEASMAKKEAPLKPGPKAKDLDIPASHPLGKDRHDKLARDVAELERNAVDFSKKPRSSGPAKN